MYLLYLYCYDIAGMAEIRLEVRIKTRVYVQLVALIVFIFHKTFTVHYPEIESVTREHCPNTDRALKNTLCANNLRTRKLK